MNTELTFAEELTQRHFPGWQEVGLDRKHKCCFVCYFDDPEEFRVVQELVPEGCVMVARVDPSLLGDKTEDDLRAFLGGISDQNWEWLPPAVAFELKNTRQLLTLIGIYSEE